MADSTLSTMDAVAALMQEREKYDGWLAGLEERRAVTPVRVYDRVRADYQGRLDQVLSELAGRASELEAVSNALRARVDTLQSEEETRMEERAEAEIRAAVGEYTTAQWEELRGVADAEIAHVSAQLHEQRTEYERVEGILTIARAPRPGSREVANDRSPAIRATPSGAASAAPPAEDSTPADAEGTSDGTTIRVVRVPRATPQAGNPGVATQPMARGAETFQAPDRPAAADGNDAAFDDLAFLKSIVEPTAGSAPPPTAPTRPTPRGEESRLSTPSRGLAALRSLLGSDDKSGSGSGRGSSSVAPGDARPAANRRDEPAASGQKTLRCAECGTLNYPTEWYCERCGGELASM